jgi:hypothetical protein
MDKDTEKARWYIARMMKERNIMAIGLLIKNKETVFCSLRLITSMWASSMKIYIMEMAPSHRRTVTTTQESSVKVKLRALVTADGLVETAIKACGSKTKWLVMEYAIMQMVVGMKESAEIIKEWAMVLYTSKVAKFNIANSIMIISMDFIFHTLLRHLLLWDSLLREKFMEFE